MQQNIRYRVRRVGLGKAGRAVVEIAKALEGMMGIGQKGVVYCQSKTKYKQMAAWLGYIYYHSSMGSGSSSSSSSKGGMRREEALWAWAEGSSSSGSRWIAAITGLGTGVDIQGIVAVVHMA